MCWLCVFSAIPVASCSGRILPAEGYLLTLPAFVESLLGLGGYQHLQGDCTDACWGEAVVSRAAPSCALIRDFICEHQLQWAFSKSDFILEDVRV